jgi:hypothetical protein
MDLKIKDLIYRENKFITNKECKKYIQVFDKYVKLTKFEESDKYIENKIKVKETDNFKSLNLNENLKEDKLIEDIAFEILGKIQNLVIKYVDYLKSNISLAIDSHYMKASHNIRILKYSKGNLIKDHLDIDPHIRAACTINLNENYEGGEFSFFSGKHLIKLKTGDAIIFPAEQIWIHGTKPIKKGTRYSINCFLRS